MNIFKKRTAIVYAFLAAVLLALSVVSYQKHWFGLGLSLEEAIEVEYARLLKENNPLIKDLNDSKFRIIYSDETLKDLLPLHNKCINYITSDASIESRHRVHVSEELFALAAPGYVGIIEILFSYDGIGNAPQVMSHMDYFTGSFRFFITPTSLTEDTAVRFMQSLQNNNASKDTEGDAFVNSICLQQDLLLGALGIDGISKVVAQNLAKSVSSQNLKSVKELLNR